MILQCERCQTRFRLEESRLPPTGARVRCSRCKHSFFAMPPGDVTRRGLAHAIAAEAAANGGAVVPAATRDLDTALADPPEHPAANALSVEDPDADLPALSSPRHARALPAEDPDADLPALSSPSHAASPPVSEAAAPAGSPDDNEWEFERPQPAAPVAKKSGAGPPRSRSGVLSEPLTEWLDAPSPEQTRPPEESPVRPTALELPSRAESNATLAPPPAAEVDGSSLDALGSPDQWDFLVSEEATPTAAAIQATTRPAPVATVPAAAGTRAASSPAVGAEAAESVNAEAVAAPSLLAPDRLASWGGIFATLFVIGVLSLVAPAPHASSRMDAVTAGPVRLDEIHGRFVEHAIDGPILVVTGVLLRDGPEPRASGQRFVLRAGDGDAVASFGLTPAESALREAPLADVRAELARSAIALAGSVLADGDRLSVTAVLSGVPRDLTRFEIGTEEVPVARPAAPDVTTETSPASPLPSSE